VRLRTKYTVCEQYVQSHVNREYVDSINRNVHFKLGLLLLLSELR